MIKTQLDELLGKEMSRKEFLQHIGAGLLMVFGVSGLMKALLQSQPKINRSQDAGYGSSAYGGMRR